MKRAFAIAVGITADHSRKDQTERQDRPKIVDETGGQNCLAVCGLIKTELQHHRVDDGHRGTEAVERAMPAGQLGRQPQPSM